MKTTLIIMIVAFSNSLLAQKNWFLSGNISWENIRESNQKQVEKRIVIPSLIDTTYMLTNRAGNGIAFQLQVEKRKENFSFATGFHFIPLRKYTTEPTLLFFRDNNGNLVQGEGIQQVVWKNEIEIPLKFSYYLSIPKSPIFLIPSLSLIFGTCTNQIIFSFQKPYSFNNSFFASSNFFIKRIAYQAELTLGYQLKNLDILTLSYFLQDNIFSKDYPYNLKGVKFGYKKTL
ncbi:MAG: hypothetical protein NZ516_02705 [Raineya sp.]|nr:hypothetical protein [Raineya sp.]